MHLKVGAQFGGEFLVAPALIPELTKAHEPRS
jgi:hypothetical protein